MTERLEERVHSRIRRYVPDIASGLAALGSDERAVGQRLGSVLVRDRLPVDVDGTSGVVNG
jgi:hypothetical protein